MWDASGRHDGGIRTGARETDDLGEMHVILSLLGSMGENLLVSYPQREIRGLFGGYARHDSGALYLKVGQVTGRPPDIWLKLKPRRMLVYADSETPAQDFLAVSFEGGEHTADGYESPGEPCSGSNYIIQMRQNESPLVIYPDGSAYSDIDELSALFAKLTAQQGENQPYRPSRF